jgi:hypothetical protein
VRLALCAGIAVAGGLAACSGDSGVTIDPFPIPVDLATGVPVALLRVPELDDTLRPVVVDTGSALSYLDGPRSADLARVPVTVEVFRSAPEVPRARIADVALILGPGGGAPDGSPISGVLGGDVLSRLSAVRFDAGRSEVRFLPNLAGESSDRENDCEAVLGTGRRGGGSFQLSEGVTFGYPATRLVVHTCLAPRAIECDGPTPPLGCDTPRGDGLLVLATGAGPSVLSRSAWRRATGQTDADIDALPTAALYLPGRQIQGEVFPTGMLPGIALVGDQDDIVGPCQELACARLCEATDGAGDACLDCLDPKDNDNDVDATVSAIELQTGVPVVIIPDTHPLLQALRNELRPALADVDGLLGMSALTRLVVEVDYSKGWVVGHCSDPSDPECLIRPRVVSLDRRAELGARGCLPSR